MSSLSRTERPGLRPASLVRGADLNMVRLNRPFLKRAQMGRGTSVVSKDVSGHSLNDTAIVSQSGFLVNVRLKKGL